MTPERLLRRCVAPALLAASLTACASTGGTQAVRAGQEGTAAPATSAPEPASPGSTQVAAPTTSSLAPATTAAPASAPSTAPPTTVTGEGQAIPSPVAGLTPAQLRAAVEAPVSGPAKRAGGATVERLVLADGTTVWRVRIPGSFRVRSQRVTVTVGGRDLGEGIVTSQLEALVAVATDPAGLVSGAPVAYRWGQEPPVAAGPLEVAR